MAAVLHRVTKEFRPSANTPDFPASDWIINPDLRLVAGIPSRYWKISGDTVSAMTQAERDAVDSQIAADAAAQDRASAEIRYDDERLIRAVALVMLDEINILRSRASLAARTADQLRTAIRSKLQEV